MQSLDTKKSAQFTEGGSNHMLERLMFDWKILDVFEINDIWREVLIRIKEIFSFFSIFNLF